MNTAAHSTASNPGALALLPCLPALRHLGELRKSVPDLVACCAASNRERFENELHRLRGFRFRRLLIAGDRTEIEAGAYRSTIKPAAVLGTLAAFEVRYDCPIVFEPDPASAARRAEVWAWYAAREAVETCNGMLRAG
jgi:DNA excision repair protein ERCC-4